VIPGQGRAAPYSVFDIANNTAWVSVGADHEYGSVRRRNHSPLVAWNGTAPPGFICNFI
jgi:hypothetical protein